MNRLKRKEADRPRAFWGALINAGVGIASALLNSKDQEKQRRLQANLEDYNNSLKEAQGMTNALNAGQDYQQNYLQQFKQQARLGTTRRLGSRNIMITDGGNAKRIGNNTYLLRGGSHEDINETGQTGIGINVGGNEIEAEGGEVAQRKGNSLRIYSAQPILGGMSPAQAIMRGYNKNKVFNAQQRFKKNNGIKDDGSKAQVGGYYGANYPSPLSLLSILYDKTLGRFDDKNPNLQTGIAPTPSRGLNLKQVRSGLVNRNMLPTNRVYRITDMREVKDAKAIGQYRKLPENVTLPTKTVRSKSGRTFTFGKAGGNSHGGKAAAMGEPWTGTTSGGYNESKYIIATPSRHTTWSIGHAGNYSKPLPADAIKKGSGLWKKFDAEGNTGISTKRMVVYKDLGNGRYLRLAKNKYRLGGDLTSKDRGSSKRPYPSVSSKDFAGGSRSYPIPTKADAIDALRLAGLHGRSDVRSKVYSKYPSLRPKAAFGDWVRSNRDDNVLANLLYESGIIDKNAWRNMLRDIHTFTGIGSDPYNDNQDEAVLTPAFGSSSTRVLSQLAKSPEASYTLKQTLGLPTKEMVRKRIAGDIAKRIGVTRAARQSSNFRNYNIARMQAANAEASFSPFANQVRYAEGKPILVNTNGYYTTAGNTISRNAKNMTSGANPFLYASKTSDEVLEGLGRVINNAKQGTKNVGQKVGNKFKGTPGQKLSDAYYNLTPMQRAKLKGLTLAATLSVPAGYFIESQNDRNKKSVSTQKDAKGKPISPYITRPQEPVKPLTGHVYKPVKPLTGPKEPVKSQTKKVTKVVKPTRQVPATIARKDTTRRDTTKQVNKVVKRQVRTTPQYTGNTTRGNYRLHDGETKVINGVKYTRRGNTIINHKTNVGYIYDKNGNYTGQADYSKVDNFNQAFDAARAAGRSQFIYRAGKYNNYSTVKETNAKKEALNRRIGARRIAKRMGCLTNPPVGRFKCGGRIRPKAEDGMLAPIYSYGSDRRKFPSFASIDITPRAIPNFKPVSVPTNTKTPFDPNSVPYLGKQSSFKPTTQDYIGLGIDTLASLGIGLINSSAAGKTYLPERPAIIQASKLPTYYNIAPQVEEIKRQRDILNGEIANNTSSSVAALNRISRIRGAATGEINKLYATKENEENKMLTQDALNQQQVAAENAKLQADYETNKANIINAASQAKANALSGTLSGLSQAWTNFASSVENRYNTRQNEAIIAATAKDPAVLSNAIQFGYNFSPEILAGIYNSTKDENLKDLVLSQLNSKNRRKYGIE